MEKQTQMDAGSAAPQQQQQGQPMQGQLKKSPAIQAGADAPTREGQMQAAQFTDWAAI